MQRILMYISLLTGLWTPAGIGNNITMIVMITNNNGTAVNSLIAVPAGVTGLTIRATGYSAVDIGTNIFYVGHICITNTATGAVLNNQVIDGPYKTNIPTSSIQSIVMTWTYALPPTAVWLYQNLRGGSPRAPGCTNSSNVEFYPLEGQWLFP